MIGTFVDVFDYATRTNAELVRLGVPRELVTFERLRCTGHVRRIAARWSRTIGWFGGVRTMRDVATTLEVPVARVHSWAQFRRLRTRTKKYVRTQAQLAVTALATPGSAREVAHVMGVLPIEAVLYRSACEILRGELGATLQQILTWTPDDLERRWQSLGLFVQYCPLAMNPDPEQLEELVREAERSTRSMIDETLALFRRELPGHDLDDEISSASERSTLSPIIGAELADVVREAERLERNEGEG